MSFCSQNMGENTICKLSQFIPQIALEFPQHIIHNTKRRRICIHDISQLIELLILKISTNIYISIKLINYNNQTMNKTNNICINTIKVSSIDPTYTF